MIVYCFTVSKIQERALCSTIVKKQGYFTRCDSKMKVQLNDILVTEFYAAVSTLGGAGSCEEVF
jgi:hypothetical protein